MRILTTVVMMALLGATTVHAQDEPMTVGVNRMTLATATKIAQAAIADCTQRGIQVGVTVVDRDGIVQAALRDTIAAQITLSISKGKAFTAVNFNAPTSQLEKRANTPLGHLPGLVMVPGGLPVQVGGALMGGVGVSGSPSSTTDEQCAQAGIDAVMEDLEMAL